MVFTLKNILGILVKNEMFFNSFAKRNRKRNKQNNRKTILSLNSLFIKVITIYLLKSTNPIILICTYT